MDTKEIVALTEKWLEQIKEVTVNYHISVAQLERVRQDYEKQTKKWYTTILPYFLPLITILIILFAFVITIKFVGCPNPIHLQWMDLEITQTCEK